MSNPVLVEITRGARVESWHRGAVAVVDASGRTVAAIGDVARPIFPRSAVKALQALAMVESGAADAYGFGPAELAFVCSSHSGEPRHVAMAAAMLARAGRSATDLECGGHAPMNPAAARALVRAGERPGPLHDNCSGKHTGFICLACHRGIDPKDYVSPDHPVQRQVAAVLGALTETRLDEANRGVDGCSIPAYAIPLERLALGFARFITGEGMSPACAAAARRLAAACWREPFMVAGTGRFDTDVLTRFSGRLFVKGGAEGVFCAALPELGLGVALKCDDGAGRASEVAMAAVIEALLPMSDEERAAFANRLTLPVATRRGAKVGEIRPVAGLVESLREGRTRSTA